MRPIKFRAKKDDPADFVFVYGELAYSTNGDPRILVDRMNWLWQTCVKGTEGQFTGLQDKNGKEIYEGDICKQVFGGKETIGKVQIESTRGAVLAGHTPVWPHDIEVLGNVWEHPELLKSQPKQS